MSSGWMVMYSKSFVDKKGHMKNDVMGTGPYKLKNYSPGVSLEYVKMRMIDVAAKPPIWWRAYLLAMWPEVKGRGKLVGSYSFQKYQDIWLAK